MEGSSIKFLKFPLTSSKFNRRFNRDLNNNSKSSREALISSLRDSLPCLLRDSSSLITSLHSNSRSGTSSHLNSSKLTQPHPRSTPRWRTSATENRQHPRTLRSKRESSQLDKNPSPSLDQFRHQISLGCQGRRPLSPAHPLFNNSSTTNRLSSLSRPLPQSLHPLL